MDNLENELSELSHDELQFVIDGFFLWANKTMKQRGINIRSWKLGWEFVGEIISLNVRITQE